MAGGGGGGGGGQMQPLHITNTYSNINSEVLYQCSSLKLYIQMRVSNQKYFSCADDLSLFMYCFQNWIILM